MARRPPIDAHSQTDDCRSKQARFFASPPRKRNGGLRLEGNNLT